MTPGTPPHHERRTYPFSAILGQQRMKLALLLNAVNPAIGGVVIRGQKGTAKSTAARGLSAVLPALPDGRTPPFVDCPLGATEDMVIGAIDLEAAIRQGVVAFQPGLLARAHLGVLYVDEINLLNDHLADSILDASESGENIVEREGQSLRHESRFILIGTMNPEEGELRPQLLDRFGLAVSVEGEREPALRVELLKRREAFDLDADAFFARFHGDEAALMERVVAARRRLREVSCPAHLSGFIAEICQRNHVAGHRADIVMDRAARAHAAWRGDGDVSADDILAVAPMVLLHRTRTAEPEIPPPPPPPGDSPDEQAPEQQGDQDGPADQNEAPSPEPNARHDDGKTGENASSAPPDSNESAQQETSAAGEQVSEIGAAFSVRKLDAQARDRVFRTGSGKRSRSRSACKQGRYVKSAQRRDRNDLAFDSTLRAAAPHQKTRRETAPRDLAVHIADSDIREKIRERRTGNIVLSIMSGSGSMSA
jgi:magnesium chelatase subunit D